MNRIRSISKILAIAITFIFPQTEWYKIAYVVSGMLAWVSDKIAKISDKIAKIHAIPAFVRKQRKYKNTVAINHAVRLNHFLAVMTHTGKPFPIPIFAQGIEIFRKPRPNGLILCSTHIPFTKVAVRHLMEHNIKPTLALAADPTLINCISIWGITEKVAAVRTGSHVLQKAKTVLQKGGSVVVLVDKTLGEAYSPNVFRLAEKINSDIIFFDAALQPDGVIKVSFYESKWNGYNHVNSIQQQLNELYQYTSNILQQYNNSGYFTAPC